jgi:hypothetical protein
MVAKLHQEGGHSKRWVDSPSEFASRSSLALVLEVGAISSSCGKHSSDLTHDSALAPATDGITWVITGQPGCAPDVVLEL